MRSRWRPGDRDPGAGGCALDQAGGVTLRNLNAKAANAAKKYCLSLRPLRPLRSIVTFALEDRIRDPDLHLKHVGANAAFVLAERASDGHVRAGDEKSRADVQSNSFAQIVPHAESRSHDELIRRFQRHRPGAEPIVVRV